MEKIINITSGRGPAECCLAVAKVLKEFLKAVVKEKGEAEVICRTKGPENGTLFSAIVKVNGLSDSFLKQWEGTIQWICQSPYRRFHKRKNWYVGFYCLEKKEMGWEASDFVFQTLRSSGPGGQHVNKTESAVRAIHPPSGISVLVRDSRSQLQNKQMAIERLQQKLQAYELECLTKEKEESWGVHNNLERGNPVRVYEGERFKLK